MTADPKAWWAIDSAPENKLVNTKISDIGGERNHAQLRRRGRLWYFADDSMYVYYRPTHWQEIPDGQI